MNNTNSKFIEKDGKAQCQCSTSAKDTECKSTDKEATKTVRHAAKDAASDMASAGKNIKTATKEMVAEAVKGGKDMCAASEKAVLEATDKALRATSHATAKASKSVRRTLNS